MHAVSHMVLYSASQLSVVQQYFLAPTPCPLKWPHHVTKRGTREDGMGEGRTIPPGGGGGGGLPYEKVGDARREFWFWPLRGTKKGVAQAFFDL